jgi:hypothetical protein
MKSLYINVTSDSQDNAHCFAVDKVWAIECTATTTAVVHAHVAGIDTDADEFTIKIESGKFKDFCKEFVKEVNFGKKPQIVVIDAQNDVSSFNHVDTASSAHSINPASTSVNSSSLTAVTLNVSGVTTIDALVKETVIVDKDSTDATITADEVRDGSLLVHTSVTGAGTFTLPSNTDLVGSSLNYAANNALKFYYVNDGDQTVTVTAGTGGTVIGTATVASGANATILVVPTSTTTHNIYLF